MSKKYQHYADTFLFNQYWQSKKLLRIDLKTITKIETDRENFLIQK